MLQNMSFGKIVVFLTFVAYIVYVFVERKTLGIPMNSFYTLGLFVPVILVSAYFPLAEGVFLAGMYLLVEGIPWGHTKIVFLRLLIAAGIFGLVYLIRTRTKWLLWIISTLLSLLWGIVFMEFLTAEQADLGAAILKAPLRFTAAFLLCFSTCMLFRKEGQHWNA